MVDELVRAAAGGDEDAFAQLVALHEKKVYNLALRMCGDPEDAWDAAQEAFLSAWRGLPSFRGEALELGQFAALADGLWEALGNT